MRTFLEHLTDAELAARLATITENGKKVAARIAAGERGEACGQHVSRGRFSTSYSLEVSLNLLRNAYKQTRTEQLNRAQKDAA